MGQTLSLSLFNNDATVTPRNANDGLDFAHFIDGLGKIAPENSIITNDAGNFTSWMHHSFRLNLQ